VPFLWFGFASVSLGIGTLQMLLHCGRDLRGGRQFVNRIRRWIGCNGRAFIGNDSLKRSMSLWATATGATNTFHSTTSEQGGVVVDGRVQRSFPSSFGAAAISAEKAGFASCPPPSRKTPITIRFPPSPA
jgi:hypothetical protein